ncbi:MAG TPA: hypothetical protein VJN63_12455 [Thermoplasmata archaeon]|nr:hypothetical protein [Thermoplasmata archaeon]
MPRNALPKKLRGAVDAIVQACQVAFGPHLKCVILKGSALKGDFVRNYSDLDIHAYVDPDALLADRTPKLEHALRFQEAIGDLDPRAAGASQFQVYFLRSDRPAAGWSPAVPGSYEVVYGEMPPALSSWKDFDFRSHMKETLARIGDDQRALIGKVLDKPNTALATYVRLAGTYVKNMAYSAALIASRDPTWTFSLSRDDLSAYLSRVDRSLAAIGEFFDIVTDWAEIERDPKAARSAFRRAIEALDAIEAWARLQT